MKLAIIIPIFNEENSIESVYHEILRCKNAKDCIILVNDGSSDQTVSIVNRWKSSGLLDKNNTTLIVHNENQGYGQSLITGFQKSIELDADYILTIDCDEQHQPKDIAKFRRAPSDFSIVSASRYLRSETRGIDAPEDRRKINTHITKKLVKMAKKQLDADWQLTDAFCGMKRYSAQFIIDFLKAYHNLKKDLQDRGYAFPLLLWCFYLQWLSAKSRELLEDFIEISIPRIYITDSRSFGEALDFPIRRLKYYLNTLKISIEVV